MVLMDRIIWAVSERHGGLGEHTAVLALTERWQVGGDKTYGAGSVSQVNTKRRAPRLWQQLSENL